MTTRTPGDCDIVISHVMLPYDANPSGNVHGGVIMKLIDSAAGVVAIRHARRNVVTASIDRLDFHHPVFIGNLLTLRASLNHVGRTSMEIGVRAETEDLVSGRIRHTASAYLTYVALGDDGKPVEVPPYEPKTDDEIRRSSMGEERRRIRLAERNREKACRIDAGRCS